MSREVGRDHYESVKDITLSQKLIDLTKKTYLCLGGNGYARMDIRQRKDTGEIFILEANALCGIGFALPSFDILQMMGKRLEDMFAVVIAGYRK